MISDLDFMKDPTLWPAWPLLFLKKKQKGEFPSFGTLVYRQERYEFHDSLTGRINGTPKMLGGEEILTKLVADGWQID